MNGVKAKELTRPKEFADKKPTQPPHKFLSPKYEFYNWREDRQLSGNRAGRMRSRSRKANIRKLTRILSYLRATGECLLKPEVKIPKKDYLYLYRKGGKKGSLDHWSRDRLPTSSSRLWGPVCGLQILSHLYFQGPERVLLYFYKRLS